VLVITVKYTGCAHSQWKFSQCSLIKPPLVIAC